MKIRIAKVTHRKIIIFLSVIIAIIMSVCFAYYKYTNKTVVLEFGTFVGSMYDVPDWKSYKALDDAIYEFEKVNPHIKVKYKSGILKTDYSEQLSQRILKGTEPDLFCVLPGDFNTFASIGELTNLNNLIKNDKTLDLSKQYGTAIKSGKYRGSQYAIAKEVDPELMFVNKTLLKKQGIKLPSVDWTWDDFYKICNEVTIDKNKDGKIDQFGTVGFDWKQAVYTNGQKLFDENGNKAIFDNEGVSEAIKFIIKLNKLNQNYIVSLKDFDDGNVAFKPFPFSTYRAYNVYPYKVIKYGQFEWECIKLPKGPEGENAGQLNSLLMGIGSRTKHEKEAWKFLKFLTNDKDVQLDVFKYSHGMPVLKEVVESKETDKELSKYNSKGKNFIDKKILSEVVEQSIVTPSFHKYEASMDIADKDIFQLINSGGDVQETLRKLNYKLNTYLKP
ncbi:extracellular solute-binding protein [Clostridium estertheticum]|uniref:ABC transporter substrate-binding protein n=1 Tax=Clostridium estertheticum TaxID=238834 RepID=UPI001CF33359|nr:extracellular solute-binding protein [Clostridium estertheticum]MCB2305490.1 extracellular solute-binding protein [Clostridium estertheticum]MCB2343929.1 extracellular solute-binding protein [Clostridium estertheticum]MCB2348846.1 extracellular solute-binding protein [Clostridium estertheticum]WAG46166.1 extracellular solute-binding protein [Clostridium estertheticum]